jgi:hypothetical protein
MAKKNELELPRPEKEGSPVAIGNTVLAMSPTTHYWMGRIVHVDAFSIVLDNSCWVASIGRHNEVLKTGKMDQNTECEPHPDSVRVAIPRAGTVVMDWPHPLWREVK